VIDGMRNKILASLKMSDTDTLSKVNLELDILEVTEAVDGKSNLESFYNIWQSHQGKVGDKNVTNSWTAFALGMTAAKPTGDFLPERRVFARAGFPDIDSDFDYFRRNEIYEYIIDKYGRDNVSNIGTYQGLKLKSAVRRIGKVLDIAGAFFKGKEVYVTENEKKVTEIIKSLPFQMGAKLKAKDDDGELQVVKSIEDAYNLCKDFRYYMDKYPGIRKHAKTIEGLLSIFGSHPSGICISDTPLAWLAPVRRSRGEGLSTQFAYEDLEEIGLIKFDILALSTLTVVARTLKIIKEYYDISIDIENLPLDDGPTLALYRSGKLIGVFQAETTAMQHVMMDISIDRFDDIVATIALFRPGPMVNIPDYCARKKGEQKIDYFHPIIEPYVKPYLKDTYGIAIFQEQIMQICNSLAGFSISDGYDVIKGIGKKKEHIINKYRKQFIEGCIKNKVPEDVATQYWAKFIVPFSGYGFNRSHASAYAYLSYMTAYLKANYTDEFMCALLNVENERKKFDKIAGFEKDLANFGIKLLPKRINSCTAEYSIVKKKDVSSGINMTEISPSFVCKGLGFDGAKEIESHRPYKDFHDLIARTDQRLVDRDAMTALIDGGFFNDYVKEYKKKFKKTLTREILLQRFADIRTDIKKAANRGVVSQDLLE